MSQVTIMYGGEAKVTTNLSSCRTQVQNRKLIWLFELSDRIGHTLQRPLPLEWFQFPLQDISYEVFILILLVHWGLRACRPNTSLCTPSLRSDSYFHKYIPKRAKFPITIAPTSHFQSWIMSSTLLTRGVTESSRILNFRIYISGNSVRRSRYNFRMYLASRAPI